MHVTELRTALIKAVHLQELRAAHATIAAATLTAKAYYHLDAIGSVRALTSSTGAELERHDYTAFGEELTSPTGLDTRRFGGKERDPETGLAYFAARYYAPETGRFAQADAPGFGNVFDPQSLNQYGYTSGNPLRWVDPSGHQARPRALNEVIIVVGHAPEETLRMPDNSSWELPFSRRQAQRQNSQGTAVRPCSAASGPTIGFGFGGLIGGNVFPWFPGLFGGASIAVTIAPSTRQVAVSAQLSGLAGVGIFAGIGPSAGAGWTHSALSTGRNASTVLEANAQWAAVGVGRSASFDKAGVAVSQGLNARTGQGYGLMVGGGRSIGYTLASAPRGCEAGR